MLAPAFCIQFIVQVKCVLHKLYVGNTLIILHNRFHLFSFSDFVTAATT